MRKVFTLLIMAVLAICWGSCSDDNDPIKEEDGTSNEVSEDSTSLSKIVMEVDITEAKTVSLNIVGEIDIDWGDGNKEFNLPYFSGQHIYAETQTYTITITGKEILRLSCPSQMFFLDVNECSSLRSLDCSDTRITTLDVSKNLNLSNLYCSSTNLTSLDVSKNTNLQTLNCEGAWGTNGKLTSLDLSQNVKLKNLSCNNNLISSLDVSKNVELTHLRCEYNQLTSLELGDNPALQEIYCNNNQLTTLNLKNTPALEYLRCYDNQLVSINIEENTDLKSIDCHNNLLTSLNFKTSANLKDVSCYNNSFTKEGWNAMFATLPLVYDDSGNIYIDHDAVCDKSIAEKRGWHVGFYQK